MFCDNLERWDAVGGGREVHEGGEICIPMLIHNDVWQRPTQYCKAIILQLKILKKKKDLSFSLSENVSGSQG